MEHLFLKGWESVMLKTHKIALDPTSDQALLLSKHCGYARVAYNHALDVFKACLDAGEFKSVYTLLREFNAIKKETYEWSVELSQNASKNAIKNLGEAIKNWRNKKLQAKFPRRHKRQYGQSYQANNGRGAIRVDGKSVLLPKIGWVRMREELRFAGEIAQATVVKTQGRWFVCLAVDTGEELPEKREGETVGIDMGLKTLATYSDGTLVENPKGRINHLYRKLGRIDKAISRSRKVHGKNNWSNRRGRLYDRRQRIYGRILNIRDDVHHKATSALVQVKTVGKVIVESLNVAGMRRNKKLSSAFQRAGISGFLRMLEYKCAWHGVAFEKADRWFASTKTCSGCGEKKVAMDLSEREYVCMECGLVLDRDLNAARNLAQYGKSEESDAASSAESKNGRGGRISPAVSRQSSMKRQLESESYQLSFVFA